MNQNEQRFRKLHPMLRERIVTCPWTCTTKEHRRYVLYLPTVNLRMEHNPAFALAVQLANSHNVPLIVLAVVGFESSPSVGKSATSTTLTPRRLAFTLEALKECTQEWKNHGAAVFIRVHGPSHRIMDHLTLSIKANAVVMDEPFVRPYRCLVEQVERACRGSKTPSYRVDGSTTVPPCAVLSRPPVSTSSSDDYYCNVPDKAWRWQKKTESRRQMHLDAAAQGAFDAPAIACPIDGNNFDEQIFSIDDHLQLTNSSSSSMTQQLHELLPPTWKQSNGTQNSPGLKPWTSTDLDRMKSIKSWSAEWCSNKSGTYIPMPMPCKQTNGYASAGLVRWQTWLKRGGLRDYDRKRNDPVNPHAPSRMSCYLNLGVVSIFKLVTEMKSLKQKHKSWCRGIDKFEEEIIKWREFSYAHALSKRDYDGVRCLPSWAVGDLKTGSSIRMVNCVAHSTNLDEMAKGCTADRVWNAMQLYLVKTGELHNNVRMTWGKTVMQWGKQDPSKDAGTILQELVFLNDRFALDGLSPPSYGGILWCFGWGDKPKNGGIGLKPASRYKTGVDGFVRAEKILLCGAANQQSTRSLSQLFSPKEQTHENKTLLDDDDNVSIGAPEGKQTKDNPDRAKKKRTLDQFFGTPQT